MEKNEQEETIQDTKRAIQERLGSEFMDVDGIAKSFYTYIPNVSSELQYRVQLRTEFKIYGILTAIGFLLTFLMMWSLWW